MTVKRIEAMTFVTVGAPAEQSAGWSVQLVTGTGTTMNKTLITFSVLTSLCVAAAVTSFASEAMSAQPPSAAQTTDQLPADPSQSDCSTQVWPRFSQSCLTGRDV